MAKSLCSRRMRFLDAPAECRMPGKKIRVGNALGPAKCEKLGRFEAEVARKVPAGDAIKLERLFDAALGIQRFSEHPIGACVPRLRPDGAPKRLFGFLQSPLPPERTAVVVVRIRPIGSLGEHRLQL